MSGVIPFPRGEVPHASDADRALAAIDFNLAAACLQEIVQQHPALGRLIMANFVDCHRAMERLDRQIR